MKRWILAAALIAGGSIASTAVAQPAGGAPASGMMGGGQGGAVLRKACQTDIEQLCGNVQPGGGHIGQCLREHQDRVSEACKSAISDARANHRNHQAPPSGSPEPAPTAPN
jgi:hypothetical protein